MALIRIGNAGGNAAELVRQIYYYDMGTNRATVGTSFNLSGLSSGTSSYLFVYSGKKGSMTLPTSLHVVFINEDGTVGSDHTENGTVDLSSYMGALVGVYNTSGTITYTEN